MTELMSMFIGPLNKNACVYFLILTIIFFIGLILVSVNEFYFIITNLNRLNLKMIREEIFFKSRKVSDLTGGGGLKKQVIAHLGGGGYMLK